VTSPVVPDPADMPRIKGYRVIRPLGAGGMGSVYVAEKLSTHQTYALKLLREDHLDNERSVARFSREIAALRAIRHPHVVSVFDWSVPEPGSLEKPFVVMELLEGEGLDQLLRRRRALPPALAVSIMVQVLDGLSAVHALEIVHRDLGPSNIFLVPQSAGRCLAKVLDFGLARPRESSDEALANVTQQGTVIGKPAYVAPELFWEKPADARSDLYACGVILFRMLAGQVPYHEHQAELLWAERYAERKRPRERPSLRAYVASIPDQLEACVARALRYKPAERYQTAEEMEADLVSIEESVLEALPEASLASLVGSEGPAASTAHGPAAVESESDEVHPARPPGRRTWLVGFVAGAALAAVLVALVLRGFGDREPSGPSGGETVVEESSAKVAIAAPVGAVDAGDADVGGAGAVAAARGDAAVRVESSAKLLPSVAEDAGGAEAAEAAAADDGEEGASGSTVHIRFAEVPRGSRVVVAGREIDPALGADVPRGTEPLAVLITAPRAGLLPYRALVVPDADRELRPRFREPGEGEDETPVIIHGAQGTTFVLDPGRTP
jgi:tRNA A-37 threonylcarbamoyl transferase component Bud32